MSLGFDLDSVPNHSMIRVQMQCDVLLAIRQRLENTEADNTCLAAYKLENTSFRVITEIKQQCTQSSLLSSVGLYT